jgi:hypothetical protein
MKVKLKFTRKSYYTPTPKKMRQIGDTLLLFSLCVSTYFIENPKAMLISSVSGALGKFLTNFFTDNGTA